MRLCSGLCAVLYVCSDNKPHKVTVGLFNLAASFYYYVVPAKSQAAYLMASVSNSSPYTILPSGNVAVFVGKLVLLSSWCCAVILTLMCVDVMVMVLCYAVLICVVFARCGCVIHWCVWHNVIMICCRVVFSTLDISTLLSCFIVIIIALCYQMLCTRRQQFCVHDQRRLRRARRSCDHVRPLRCLLCGCGLCRDALCCFVLCCINCTAASVPTATFVWTSAHKALHHRKVACSPRAIQRCTSLSLPSRTQS